MKEIVLHLGSFIGGLFLGYLSAVLAFLVWELVKEGLGNPKQMAIPATFLLCIFGAALAYLIGIVLESGVLLLGTAITFVYAARQLFKSEEQIENSH